MLHQLTSIVADTVQHAVKHDTVVVHDTVRLTDTVRVLVREGSGAPVLIGTGVAVATAVFTLVWKLWGLWERRHQAQLRINAEAFSLHRELQASLGNGPPQDQASVWTQQCQRGFDVVEPRFTRLTELALNASKQVRRLIGDERRRFLEAANIVNESLVGAWGDAKAKAAGQVHREFQTCLEGLSRVIDLTRE